MNLHVALKISLPRGSHKEDRRDAMLLFIQCLNDGEGGAVYLFIFKQYINNRKR